MYVDFSSCSASDVTEPGNATVICHDSSPPRRPVTGRQSCCLKGKDPRLDCTIVLAALETK